jgi:hypothetical protein
MRLDKQSNEKAWDVQITSDTAFTAFLGLLFCALPVHERARKTSASARRAAKDNQEKGEHTRERGRGGCTGENSTWRYTYVGGSAIQCLSLSRRSLLLSRPSHSHSLAYKHTHTHKHTHTYTHTHTCLFVCTQSVSPLLPAKTCPRGDLLRTMSTRTQEQEKKNLIFLASFPWRREKNGHPIPSCVSEYVKLQSL